MPTMGYLDPQGMFFGDSGNPPINPPTKELCFPSTPQLPPESFNSFKACIVPLRLQRPSGALWG